jgi:hypothetical protein
MRCICNILAGKPEGKRQMGRSWPKSEDNIKVDLREIGLEFVDWIHLAQDGVRWWALVMTVMNCRIP